MRVVRLGTAIVALALGFGLSGAGDRVARAQPLAPLDASGPVTFWVQPPPARGDAQLARWALRAWARAAGDRVRLREVRDEDAALIRVYWVGDGGGKYGEMRPLRVGGRRGAAVFVMPSTDALGGDVARRAARDPLFRDTVVYLTCVHELGHAFGLSHTDAFSDIMYSFQFGGDLERYFARYRDKLERRRDIAKHHGMSAADRRRVRALYR